ncbi:hypothetical protein F511_34553 [Dorcoceras hygrometricum]|uniref:Uncharacterized protein n=1 Tax=Dorcoceras hygrometricum TaxID=472368 RepID=A0A2Z7A5X0_9LAMI|nr:hypothetical protein F511_34553 [Dorcoceras hygrometricum]
MSCFYLFQHHSKFISAYQFNVRYEELVLWAMMGPTKKTWTKGSDITYSIFKKEEEGRLRVYQVGAGSRAVILFCRIHVVGTSLARERTESLYPLGAL